MLTAEQLIADIDILLREFPDLAGDEELRADVLEGETDIKPVLERLVGHVQMAEANDKAVIQLADALISRRKRFQSRADFFRSLIRRVMDAGELQKVVLPGATLSIRNVPPNVIITDEAALPDKFLRTTRSPDKKALAEALKTGQPIPGATLSNGSTTLSVRT